MSNVGALADCRHYVMQTVRSGERVERCRLGASATVPFACPDGCLFYEQRSTSATGWHVGEADQGDGTAKG
jgi:hypothetical protein